MKFSTKNRIYKRHLRHCKGPCVVFLLLCVLVTCFSVPAKALGEHATGVTPAVLKIAIQTGPVTLDPRFATGASSIRMLRLISSGLVRLNKNFDYEPVVAETVEHKGFKEFHVTLKNRLFHDGTRLHAEDVKAFYESILDPETGSPLRGSLQGLEKIEIMANRVSFYLSKPNPWFWSALEIPIVKLTDSTIKNPIGLGRYQLKEMDNQKNITLERVEQNQNLPKTLVFKVVKDPVVRMLKILKGDVDVIYNDIPEELYQYGLKKELKGQSTPSASYTYVGFNLESGPTANRVVRQALAHAIDREKIMKTLLGGRATDAKSLLMPKHPAHHAAKITPYDPEKAKKLLQDAGYENLSLQLSITTNPFIMRLAQVIQQQLGEIGVAVKLSSSEWGTFYGSIKKGNFQSYILTWVGLFQPDIFYNLFHSDMMPPHGANRGRYVNSEMDDLLDQMQVAQNGNDVMRTATAVQKLQEKDMIYLPLWRRHHTLLSQEIIVGCTILPDGGYEGLLNCKQVK